MTFRLRWEKKYIVPYILLANFGLVFFLIRESLLHLVSISNWYHLIIVFNMFIVLLNISQFFQQNQVKPTNSYC